MTINVLTNAPLPVGADLQQTFVELGFELSFAAAQDDLYSGGFCPMVIGVGDEAIEAGVEIYKSDAASFARERNLGECARFGQVVTFR
jgi:hypothetical protein